ncbi:hypothetical protein MCOR27_002437 [Pyricularia oryzae]|uniref:Cupin type-2 domain-containing protein n=5 Tax=Pyricularia TaxID=48558 RepID=A0ABQ8NJH3_PYRGI|nr:cupin domain-containing protein [Pyricularia oryzae 70-15]ELQ40971.1 cupin domain-containing protein [Pyricularia oryzae Y34]KAH8845376.1 hypothetical protein MCOR01_002620 [Pyricularia oryzae]KAI6298007.1 hypothetical protein MCOR33_005796 [Pyricularia grisea]EHA46825.1 cupin domain-containing protein [Pyricularia oryzae 70-15]KAH9433159.1 hypothetical protein MCOR02_007824 [Pyricularia oryzae]
MALEGTLRHPDRYITTHDETTGKAIVDTSIPAKAPFYRLGDGKIKTGVEFAQCFITSAFPAELAGGADLASYSSFLASPPGLVVNGGTVLRYVDMEPGHVSPMHRTLSMDYGIVIEGEVELLLDSGDTRPMKRGDVCVQRATMHAWRNLSSTEWARMLFILQPVQPFEVGGKMVEEDLGTMKGVKKSE